MRVPLVCAHTQCVHARLCERSLLALCSFLQVVRAATTIARVLVLFGVPNDFSEIFTLWLAGVTFRSVIASALPLAKFPKVISSAARVSCDTSLALKNKKGHKKRQTIANIQTVYPFRQYPERSECKYRSSLHYIFVGAIYVACVVVVVVVAHWTQLRRILNSCAWSDRDRSVSWLGSARVHFLGVSALSCVRMSVCMCVCVLMFMKGRGFTDWLVSSILPS